MTRPLRFCVVLLVSLAGCADHGAPRTTPSKPGASGVTEISVRAHLEFLASDALNGRGSGTRDELIAAEYVGAQFRRLGLKPGGTGGGYVQTVEIVRATATGKPSIAIGDSLKWTFGKEFVAGSLASPSIAGPLHRVSGSNPAVARGAVVFLAEENMDLAGRLAQSGAAAILMKRNLTQPQWDGQAARTPSLGIRLTGLPVEALLRPTIVSLNADAATALARIADGTQIRIDAPVGESQKTYTYNAVGILPGADPSGEAILVSAHLDHLGQRESAQGSDKIYNGADDDASGTVAVIELAEALAKKKKAPKRSIIFACFGSEEAGGFGATYLREMPPVPLDKMVAMVQFEMIGRPDNKVPAKTLWLTGYERSDLGPTLAARGARLVQDPHPEQSFFTRSDNITFARRGVVAHTVSSYGLHREYHTPADETKAVDYAHMTEAIGSMVEPLAWLASAAFKPAWKPGMKP
jgi:aminopeptidase YwaD